MYEYTAEIVSIYDGDTVRLNIDLGMGVWQHNVSARVNGIDCPEMNTKAGKAARAFALSVLKVGETVKVRTLKDRKEKYGRYLVEITLKSGESYAALAIAAGHAVSYSGGKRQTRAA